VLYKLITKVITNKLKEILPSIISANQSACTLGRLITDSSLVAFEMFHSIKINSNVKGGLVVKLNMSKAHDKVEWIFLRSLMLKMRFRQAWIDLMMHYVEMVTFSFVINREPIGFV